ncbi:MAG TPA: universal stress protein [Burkholderiaceae bacterium]|nr:universal stress protein [Burkholderiaceae bacterium]
MEGAVYDSQLEEQLKQKYKDILDDGLRRLTASGFPARGEVLVGDSVEVITGYARKINPDLIVVGHKHLDGWAARWWRGSGSPALIEHSHCSVLVVIAR